MTLPSGRRSRENDGVRLHAQLGGELLRLVERGLRGLAVALLELRDRLGVHRWREQDRREHVRELELEAQALRERGGLAHALEAVG